MVEIDENGEIKGLKIYQAGLGDADLVAMMVFELLKELKVKQTHEDENHMVRACRDILEEDSSSKALIALDGNNKALSVMTLAEAQALHAFGRFGIIMEHYVVPEARSLGVGEKMLDFACHLGKKNGWTLIQVAAPGIVMGQRTQQFYERNHFKISGNYMQLNLKGMEQQKA